MRPSKSHIRFAWSQDKLDIPRANLANVLSRCATDCVTLISKAAVQRGVLERFVDVFIFNDFVYNSVFMVSFCNFENNYNDYCVL